MRDIRRNSLRARGSMTYLEFVRLIKRMWEEGHPDIPILPTGGDQAAEYPCLTYGLELRTTHRDDPKPRLRETTDEDGGRSFINTAQRFDNIVSFTAITEQDPILAEEIIEAFEDFMSEITPAIKELGASELVYSRRYPDHEQNRQGEGVTLRKVAYKLTTEKVTATEYEKLQSIIISARQFNTSDEINPVETTNLGDSPRYYSYGGVAPAFYITPSSKTNNEIIIPFTFFRPGDAVYLAPGLEGEFPESITPGYYQIQNLEGIPYSKDVAYEIARRGFEDPIADFGASDTANEKGYIYSGRVFYVADGNVSVNITQ